VLRRLSITLLGIPSQVTVRPTGSLSVLSVCNVGVLWPNGRPSQELRVLVTNTVGVVSTWRGLNNVKGGHAVCVTIILGFINLDAVMDKYCRPIKLQLGYH